MLLLFLDAFNKDAQYAEDNCLLRASKLKVGGRLYSL